MGRVSRETKFAIKRVQWNKLMNKISNYKIIKKFKIKLNTNKIKKKSINKS